MKLERIYVFPKFKKILKQEALEKGKTVAEWTKEFTEIQDPFHQLAENIRKRKGSGKLDFP